MDTSTPLGELIRDICQPTIYRDKPVRAVSRGEFCVNGFRNRDLQSLLFDSAANTPEEQRRRSARVSRLLRMLPAHHLIQKVPRTHRYLITPRGRDILSAVLAAHRIRLDQLNKLAA